MAGGGVTAERAAAATAVPRRPAARSTATTAGDLRVRRIQVPFTRRRVAGAHISAIVDRFARVRASGAESATFPRICYNRTQIFSPGGTEHLWPRQSASIWEPRTR